MVLRFSLISIQLSFPTCLTLLRTIGENSLDCSTTSVPVAQASIQVKMGPVVLSQKSYLDLLWELRRHRSRSLLGSGDAVFGSSRKQEASLGGSRKLLQSRQFTWEHSVGSNSLGQAKIGVFFSSRLPETPPEMSLEVLYGGLQLFKIDSIPRATVRLPGPPSRPQASRIPPWRAVGWCIARWKAAGASTT